MNEISYNSIILHLSVNIVRQVDEVKIARALWIVFDTMLLTKTLLNKIFLLEKLFSLRMDSGKELELNLSEFIIIVKSFVHNEKKFDDEDLALILLNSLPDLNKDVRNAIKYSRDKLTQTIVIDALRSRELEVKNESKSNPRDESMFVRGRTEKREQFSHKEVSVMIVSSEEVNKDWIIYSGYIAIKMHDGTAMPILNVRYIPNLKRNLISLRILEDEGHIFMFDNKTMGHIGNKGLKSLSNQKLLGKDLVEILELCKNCVFGNSHRVSFETGPHVNKKPLDYVIANVWRPESHPTFGDNRYFLSIVDDYYRKGIKIINSRNVKFNEFEMPCLKRKTNTSAEPNNNIAKNEVKLTRLSNTQLDSIETNILTPQKDEGEPKEEDTSLQDYQLVRKRERQVKPNPRYESWSCIDFDLMSGESIEQVEPTSYEEIVRGLKSGNWKRVMEEEMQSLNENKLGN
ncbi:uncharacterized protein LOC111391515 [Olea europaea var. sylvestris]|uniref:uncharacterized protein LOC111391515 n=1 Tax=Olea europaea var. sylvestris TaxID=158386 RepID=UPI000C1D700D|nr:uncharacterized protein LOC111391515 [Olea europaea var. sylvestris]